MSTERDHLDAETLAAWMDNGLDAVSRAAAEAHASNCERCQQLLATMTKTMPVRLQSEATSKDVVSGFSRIRWWLAPIAATAAAVTLWMVVPRENGVPPAARQPAALQQESKVSEARDATAPTGQAAPPPVSAPAEAPSAAPERQPFAESAKAQAPALADAATKKQDAQGKRENTLERADASAPAPPAVAAAAPAPAAPAPAAAAERRVEPLQGAAANTQLSKQTASSLQVISPDPASRWRVAQGFIERSEDGGASWLPMRPVTAGEIRAGSSPSRLVCWLVGTRGLVLLATDGTNFTRLPFPEQIDLATVTATSAASATITTADGRTFSTSDSGRSWRNP